MSIFEHFSDIQVNFSQILGVKLFSENGKKLGLLTDLFVDYEEIYPTVIAIQYKVNKQYFYIAWNNIKSYSQQKIIIQNNCFVGRSRTFPKVTDKKIVKSILANQFSGSTIEYPGLGKIILDKQIVDTSGKKVVRVNDIQLIKAGESLRVTHAAVGLRSMIRRLGYESFIDATIKLLNPKATYLKKDILINWKFVHAIPNKSIHSSVKLNLSNEDIKNLHPADLADILEDLDNYGRELIFNNLDPKMAAETLSEVEDDIQVNLIKNESPEDAAKIIEQMDTDDAADILNELGEKKAGDILSKIEDTEAGEEIQELLEYDEHSAGGLMSTEYFSLVKDTTKEQVLKLIEQDNEELETVYDLYIVDRHNSLIGTCPLREILAEKENLTVNEIMNFEDIKSVTPDVHWKEVALIMSKYNLINIPVINEKSEKLIGIVSVDDILPRLLNEK